MGDADLQLWQALPQIVEFESHEFPLIPLSVLEQWKSGTLNACKSVETFIHKYHKVCPYPGCPGVYHNNLKVHITRKHMEGRFLCLQCYKKWNNEVQLEDHRCFRKETVFPDTHTRLVTITPTRGKTRNMESMDDASMILAAVILLGDSYLRLKKARVSKNRNEDSEKGKMWRFLSMTSKMPYELQCRVCILSRNPKNHGDYSIDVPRFDMGCRLMLHLFTSKKKK